MHEGLSFATNRISKGRFWSSFYQRELFYLPRLTDARRARGNPYWYSRTNNFDSTAAGKGLSSTLTFDGHLEILHHSPLPRDSRCYCHRRCCTLCHLTVEKQNFMSIKSLKTLYIKQNQVPFKTIFSHIKNERSRM